MSDSPASVSEIQAPAPWIYDRVNAWFAEMPQRPIAELIRDCIAESCSDLTAERDALERENKRLLGVEETPMPTPPIPMRWDESLSDFYDGPR